MRSNNLATLTVPGHAFQTGIWADISGLGGTGYNLLGVQLTVVDAAHVSYPCPGADELVAADANGLVSPEPDDDSGTLQVALDQFTVDGDLANVSSSQSADAINDNAVLVVVFSAANPAVFEIMTLRSLAVVGGVYQLNVRRSRYNTLRQAFSTGDRCFIIERSELTMYSHALFSQFSEQGTTATFRLQAFTPREVAELGQDQSSGLLVVGETYTIVSDQAGDDFTNIGAATNATGVVFAATGTTPTTWTHGSTLSGPTLCPDINYTFTDVFAPTVTWFLLEAMLPGTTVFSPITDWTDGFPVATRFQFSFTVTCPAALQQVEMIALNGSTQQLIFARTYAGDGSASCTATFTLPAAVSWNVIAVVKDASGLVSDFQLTPPVPGTPTQLVLIPAVDQCEAPAVTPASGSVPMGFVHLTIASATPGSSGAGHVFFQVRALGQQPVAGSAYWLDYNAVTAAAGIAYYAVYVAPGQPVSIYAYVGNVSGLLDSEIVRVDYTAVSPL